MKTLLRVLPFLAVICLRGVESAARPNILFILADDQSYRSLGCYGYAPWSWVRTPHIDALAADGVRFVSAYCGSWCVPSRASLLTGLQPHAIRGFDPERRIFSADTCRFWPAALRAGGYTTALIGKWHLKGYGEQRLWSRDWDHWVAWDHTREGNGGYYGEKSPDRTQLLNLDGRDVRQPGYSTDNYTRFAVDFIRRPHAQPWLLWLCFSASHAPYIPAERHRDRYRDSPVPLPADTFGPHADKAALMRDFTMLTPGRNRGDPPRYVTDYLDADLAECVRVQNRTVCAIDEGVGELLAALRATGQLDRTLIVYAADNGFPWGEQGYANKTGPYEACQRTPLIVSWPAQFARGAVCSAPVGQLDLVPTFLAVAGVAPPWELHGHDLRPLLTHPRASWPHPVLLEYFNEDFGDRTAHPTPGETKRTQPWNPPGWWLTLRQDRFVYLRWIAPDEIEELYDLERDPQQLQNLSHDPAHRATLGDFRARLRAELRRTHAALADHLPPPRIAANP